MSVIRDLKVKIRFNVLTTDQVSKSTNERKSKRDGSQGHIIEDVPEFVVPYDELIARLTQAGDVLLYGYAVDTTKIPPAVETDDATAIAATTATLRGYVKPGGINTTVGFQFGTDRSLGTNCVCIANPLTGTTNQAILYDVSNLKTKTRYWYRAYATDANYATGKFGVLRSFTTL